ncbi:MAG: S8 family serine peptidase [Candidatus Sericytochromatia bacterium]|nr:S8 family serine peptidase [Candidatus Sericytochromatia bacterium]
MWRVWVFVWVAACLVGCGPAAGTAGVPALLSLPLQAHVGMGVGAPDWNLAQVSQAPVTGGEPVIVAVFDTGADALHPSLAGQVYPGLDLVGQDHHTAGGSRVDYTGRDGNGHGTHVAGIVRTVAGDAPVRILPVKVIPHDGNGNDRWLAEGIQRALAWRAPDQPRLRARVFNLSVASPGQSARLTQAIRQAQREGVLVIAAAGNDAGPVSFPASLPEVLAVGATDERGERAAYSSYGEALDLTAPGGSDFSPIVSAWPTFVTASERETGGRLEGLSAGLVGTSMSAPHVSAAAAVLWSQFPGLHAGQVRACLLAAADDAGEAGPDPQHGFGRLNMGRALRVASRDDLR